MRKAHQLHCIELMIKPSAVTTSSLGHKSCWLLISERLFPQVNQCSNNFNEQSKCSTLRQTPWALLEQTLLNIRAAQTVVTQESNLFQESSTFSRQYILKWFELLYDDLMLKEKHRRVYVCELCRNLDVLSKYRDVYLRKYFKKKGKHTV